MYLCTYMFVGLSWQSNTHFGMCLKMDMRPEWNFPERSMLLPAIMVLNSCKRVFNSHDSGYIS